MSCILTVSLFELTIIENYVLTE